VWETLNTDLTGTKPLVDIVGLPRVPAAGLDAAVADLTAALLATDAATARAVKELLGLAPRHTLEEQSAAERRIQAELQRERLNG